MTLMRSLITFDKVKMEIEVGGSIFHNCELSLCKHLILGIILP